MTDDNRTVIPIQVRVLSDHALVRQARREPPSWADEPLEDWRQLIGQHRLRFTVRKYRHEAAAINLFGVVGSQHPKHQGRSWLDLLLGAPRMGANLREYERHPDYYRASTACQKIPPLYYQTLDGLRFYIGQNGNHRTCIARFDAHFNRYSLIHGVYLTHYQVDDEFHRRFLALCQVAEERRLDFTFVPVRYPTHHEVAYGWSLDRYRPALRTRRAGDDSVYLLDRARAGRLLACLRSHRHRRFWRFWPDRYCGLEERGEEDSA